MLKMEKFVQGGSRSTFKAPQMLVSLPTGCCPSRRMRS